MVAVARLIPGANLVIKPFERAGPYGRDTTSVCPWQNAGGQGLGRHSSTFFQIAGPQLAPKNFRVAGRDTKQEAAAFKASLDGKASQAAQQRSLRSKQEDESRSTQLRSLPPSDGLVKECIECHHSKLIEDFTQRKSSEDGRHPMCRACLSSFRKGQKNTDSDQVAMTVEEAWERSKACVVCGHVKELRDFHRQPKTRDGFKHCCRACVSLAGRKQNVRPTDLPKVCPSCKKVKAATEFYPSKRTTSGLYHRCKICLKSNMIELTKRNKERPKVPIVKKICTTCGLLKKSDDFAVDTQKTDGLSFICKPCKAAKERQRYQSKKQ